MRSILRIRWAAALLGGLAVALVAVSVVLARRGPPINPGTGSFFTSPTVTTTVTTFLGAPEQARQLGQAAGAAAAGPATPAVRINGREVITANKLAWRRVIGQAQVAATKDQIAKGPNAQGGLSDPTVQQRLQQTVARAEAAGEPTVALAEEIQVALALDMAGQEGLLPTDAAVQAAVARHRAAPLDPSTEAFIDGYGTDRYWADDVSTQRRNLAAAALSAVHKGTGTPQQQQQTLQTYAYNQAAAARIEVLDPAALSGVTVQRALAFLKAASTAP